MRPPYAFGVTERVVPLNRATDPDWHLDPANLAELYRYLRDRGREPADPVNFMERPYAWSEEWVEMWADRQDEL